MSARFFGQFVLERGVVTAAGLLQAVEYQKARNLKLGELAVREGLLTTAEADFLNLEQRRTDAKFGEVAKLHGKLTDEQVGMLIALQKQSHVMIGAALVAVGAITEPSLAEHLDAYAREEEQEGIRISSSRSAIPWVSGPVYRTFVQLTSRLLVRVADIQTKEAASRELSGALPPADLQVAVTVTGGWTGDYILRVSDPLARRIAARMLGEEKPDAAIVPDAVKEFANTLCGQACAALEPAGIRCDLSPPRELLPNEPRALAGRKVALFPLESTEGIVEVALSPS